MTRRIDTTRALQYVPRTTRATARTITEQQQEHLQYVQYCIYVSTLITASRLSAYVEQQKNSFVNA